MQSVCPGAGRRSLETPGREMGLSRRPLSLLATRATKATARTGHEGPRAVGEQGRVLKVSRRRWHNE